MTDTLSPPDEAEDLASSIEDLLDDLRTLLVLLERYDAMPERAEEVRQLSAMASTSFDQLDTIAARLDAADTAEGLVLIASEDEQIARARARRDVIIETIEGWRRAPDIEPSRH